MTGSAPTPQAMTLEEAMARLGKNGWSFRLLKAGNEAMWSVVSGTGRRYGRAPTWPEAVSQALGYPVVERDDTAELVEALENTIGLAEEACGFILQQQLDADRPVEEWPSVLTGFGAVLHIAGHTLAKWKERNGE